MRRPWMNILSSLIDRAVTVHWVFFYTKNALVVSGMQIHGKWGWIRKSPQKSPFHFADRN